MPSSYCLAKPFLSNNTSLLTQASMHLQACNYSDPLLFSIIFRLYLLSYSLNDILVIVTTKCITTLPFLPHRYYLYLSSLIHFSINLFFYIIPSHGRTTHFQFHCLPISLITHEYRLPRASCSFSFK